jgi:hypothetical protein
MSTLRPTIANTRPLTHYLEGFHEVLVPEDVMDFYREHPVYLGQLIIDCVDSDLAPFFMTPLYEEDAE